MHDEEMGSVALVPVTSTSAVITSTGSLGRNPALEIMDTEPYDREPLNIPLQNTDTVQSESETLDPSTQQPLTPTLPQKDTVNLVLRRNGSIESISDPSSSRHQQTLPTHLHQSHSDLQNDLLDDQDEVPVDLHLIGGGSGSSGLEYTTAPIAPDLPDTKEGIEELCPVCGDKVSGYHYGLLTCESCKGFFKRTVQNKKVYTCVAERSCHIDKTQRKRCPYCRFQKCLEVGMKLEAVRADRMRGGRNKFGPMYKRDRARKLQLMRQRQLAVQHARHQGLPLDGISYSPNNSAYVTQGGVTIKQEIQIPQVSSLTSSPDSSPSPTIASLTMGNGGTQGILSDPKIWATSSTSPNSPASKGFTFDPNTNTHNHNSLNHEVVSVVETHGSGSSGAPSSHSNVQSHGGGSGGKMPPLIRDLLTAVDDKDWQTALFSLLQNQTYNQCEVDLFELLCKVLDQNLFAQVDWARNSVFFKDLKVDDQMKLLQHSWSDMLVLDHIHHRLHNHLPDDSPLPNGQKFDLLALALLGVPASVDKFNEISAKLQDMKFDVADYICLKFLLLLNPEVKQLQSRRHVQETHDHVQQSLLTYCINCYPQVQEKFTKLLTIMPELRQVAARGEEYLYYKHCNGGAPTQTLLMEMLHAKRK